MVTVERVTLVIAVLTLLVAFFQLRSANQALDANNAFLVESNLLDLGIDALETIQEADQSDTSVIEIKNAFRRYAASLVVAKSLEDNGGLSKGTWNDILATQCAIFDGNFYYLPDLETECLKR